MDITLKEIKEAYLYQKNEKYSGLRSLQKTEQSYYDQSFNPFPNETPGHPYITHKVKPPRGRRIVDGPADWLAMDKVICSEPPKAKPSGEIPQKAQKAADKNERWGNALLDYMAMIQPYYLRMAAQQLPLRGECWLKNEVSWNYVENPEEFEGVPFKWVVPDSMMVYATLELDAFSRPQMLFEEKVHTVGHVRRLIAQWNKGHKETPALRRILKDFQDHQDIFLVEWWTPEFNGYFAGLGGITETAWHAIPIDGEERVPNLCTVVPYVRGFNSLGIWPYDGDLRKLVVGFLRPMGDVIVQDSRDRSKIDTITNYWAAPIMSWITDGSISIEEADKIVAPGNFYNQIKDRKELKIEVAPPIPSAILDQIRLNEALLEEYDPMLLRGRGTPGETAVGQSQRVGLGLQKWEPLKITLRQMIANMLSTTFKIVEEMGVGVRVYEQVLTKDDIKGYYKMVIDIKPGNPEEQMRGMLLYKDMKDFYPRELAVEKFLGEGDATEFLRQRDIGVIFEQELMTPLSPIRRAIMSQAMKEIGMEEMEAEMEAEVKSSPPPSAVGGGIMGQHAKLGEAGLAGPPPVGEPQSQEELDAAREALAELGGM